MKDKKHDAIMWEKPKRQMRYGTRGGENLNLEGCLTEMDYTLRVGGGVGPIPNRTNTNPKTNTAPTCGN